MIDSDNLICNGWNRWFFGVLPYTGKVRNEGKKCIIYMKDGYIHNAIGPAIIWDDGIVEWRLNSKWMSFKRFSRAANLPDEDILMFKLKYGG